ncbi:MAG: hypothetical protein RIT30_1202, partial [Bacteroidota bacterium]
MLVDKITLKDIGLFDTDESEGLISHLNFCKSNGGKEQLDQYLAHPLNSIEAIEKRQKAIVVFIKEIDFVHEMKITNGTTLVIEKFFGTAFKPIPTQISYPGAYWYQYINGADYALLKYSLEHLILFYENLNNWLLVFENKNENPIVAHLVQNIKKLVQHPSLANLNTQSTLANPQKLLMLAYFFRNHYKNNTLQLLQYFFELDAYYSMAMATKKFNFVFPTWIKSETPLLEVVSGIHPLVPNPVDNTISLSSQTNLFFLTGANMAGKSTFIKTLGIVIYLAHVGIGAPAKKVTLSLFDGLITNLTIADNVVKGESYFFNEVQRIK